MKKGIVIGAHVDADQTRFILRSPEPPPEALRQYVLYWDKILFPVHSQVFIPPQGEIGFLVGDGYAEAAIVHTPGLNTMNAEFYSAMQTEALLKKTADKETDWTIGQCGKLVNFPKNKARELATIEFELYRLLPTPSEKVNINEILEFKNKRDEELADLREHIDDMVNKITSAGDLIREKNRQTEKLQRSINQIKRCLEETKLHFVWRSLTTVITDPVFGMAATGAMFSGPYSIPVGIAGLAASAIKNRRRFNSIDTRLPPNQEKLAYLAHSSRDLQRIR